MKLIYLYLCFLAICYASSPMAPKTDWYPCEGGNNQKNKDWGVSGDIQIWEYPTMRYVQYEDYNPVLPSPRAVSNLVGAATKGKTNVTPRKVTSFLTAFAQFLNHDLVYTTPGEVLWPIQVPKCDPHFDTKCEGDKKINFNRSACHAKGCQYKINEATAFIDGSQIYGSTYKAQSALRSFKDGLLLTSLELPSELGEYPPHVYEIKSPYDAFVDVDNDAHYTSLKNLFYCGDPRCNENPMLCSIHILFLREHNRVARFLLKIHPDWDDDKLFQAARKYVIAELQQIVFDEFLYWLLGERPFPIPYKGYDDNIDPRIHTFFSTVAFRYGHSEVSDYISYAAKGAYGLFPFMQYADMKHLYFNPFYIWDLSPTSVWVGMAKNLQQSMDTQFDDVIRNYLFIGKHKHPQQDLMSTDIHRADDHGIPPCNEVRKAYNLNQPKTWAEFNILKSGDPNQLYGQLSSLYNSPDDAHAFICGLAEDWVQTNITTSHKDTSNLGQLFEAAIISQFHRLRAGDRFWYELHIDTVTCNGELPPLKTRTLAQIIRDNSHVAIDIDDTVFAVENPIVKGFQDEPQSFQQKPFQQEHFQHEPFQHEPFQHEPFQHEPFQHEPLKHEPFEHEPFDHEPFDHEPFEHEPLKHEPFEHEPFEHEPFEHEPFEHEPFEHEPFEHEPFEHEPFEHEPFEHEPFEHEPFEHEPFEHEPFEHEPFQREGDHNNYQSFQHEGDYNEHQHGRY